MLNLVSTLETKMAKPVTGEGKERMEDSQLLFFFFLRIDTENNITFAHTVLV